MIKVLIKADSRYPVDRERVRKKVKEVLKRHGVKEGVEVGVVFVGDRKMAELNKKYLKREGTTNVLSFSLEAAEFPDGVLRLGEVIISYPQALKEAAEENLLVDEKIDKLLEHGVLNLLGVGE